MTNIAFRKLHRKTSLIVFLPLLLTALTGIAYRLGRSWFGMSKEVAEIFMVIHQGEYLGDQLKPIYVVLLGLGLLGMVVTGLTMTRLSRNSRLQKKYTKVDFRRIHQLVAPIIFLPLVVSSITGIGYRVTRSYLGWTKDQSEIFLVIHQGEYLGDFFKPIYVLLVGLGLLGMLVTGINMTTLFRKRRVVKSEEKIEEED
ncbi:MAG: PepSY domain-containing protein [Phormidium sp.]